METRLKKFHVVVVQQRQKQIVQKSVMHVQSRCFAKLDLLLICRSPVAIVVASAPEKHTAETPRP